jgi:hypothetical protein
MTTYPANRSSLGRREFLGASLAAFAPKPASRTVVVADVHGDYERFVDVLTFAGILGDKEQWAGGASTLLQIGDVADRGPASHKVYELLRRLQKDAKKTKGRVEMLLGNHEAMRLTRFYRDAHPGEFEAFRTPKSEKARDDLYAQEMKRASQEADIRDRTDLGLDNRSKWDDSHPLGLAEMEKEYSPSGETGRWLRERPIMLVEAETIFVHGGISPKFLPWTPARFQDRARQELEFDAPVKGGLLFDNDGPLWWRGLALEDEAYLAPHVDELLAMWKAKRIVVGHTVQEDGPVSRLNGKIILADAGLSAYYKGPRSCVVLENGQIYPMVEGKRVQFR